MSVFSSLDALDGVRAYFERMPELTTKAASLSINQVATRSGIKMLRESIYEQVAFPKDYLSGNRLMVSRKSRPTDLEAVIVARKRATSLARFAGSTPIGGGQFLPGGGRAAAPQVTVRIKGASKALRAAWLVKLNKGASLTEDNYNVGLAVRVRTGDVGGKFSQHTSWLVKPNDKGVGVALLYGPSVDQVFKDVSVQDGPAILDMVRDEFFRQFNRLSGQ